MKFSIIGTGFILPTHIEAIQKVGTITGLNTDEDCVVILTPNDTHYKYALQHAKKRKMVLCEKPITIRSIDAEDLSRYDNIYTVLQLRHHKFLKQMKGKNIDMDISVYRDEKYYNGWKGDEMRSGGIMFNLGIHYFDVLFTVFGKPKKANLTELTGKTAKGTIWGDKYTCNFQLSTKENRENQRRIFKVDGKEFNFSKKDNLAYENLHIEVYKDLVNGKGVKVKDMCWLIRFIENLKNYKQV
jgi:UDP-N-acetyl-2-amino-2-deoxyglucuronate dehydrogenase